MAEMVKTRADEPEYVTSEMNRICEHCGKRYGLHFGLGCPGGVTLFKERAHNPKYATPQPAGEVALHGFPNCECDLEGGDPDCRIQPPYESPLHSAQRQLREALTALEACKRDLAAMTEDRDLWQAEHGNDCPYKEKAEALKQDRDEARYELARLPADWFTDSSLETWFPITAEILKKLEFQVQELQAKLAEKKSR